MLWICRAGQKGCFFSKYIEEQRIYLPWDGYRFDLSKYNSFLLNLIPLVSSLYPFFMKMPSRLPVKIKKKPRMLIDVEVGSAISTEPRITRVVDTIISFVERTLIKFFSIINCLAIGYT